MKNECLIFYVKFPKESCVKTRLAKDIGTFHAVGLYRCFILDLAATIQKLPQDILFCYSPKDAENMFRSWFGEKFYYLPQSEGDLGVRMNQSFEQAFQNGYKRAVVIGSDSPDLPKEILEQAFVELQKSDAVIGPSTDGGYWLIGFNSKGFCPEAFEGISWSTEKVFEETMKKLRFNRRSVTLMPEWIDIDTLASLKTWYKRITPLSLDAYHTRTYLDTYVDLFQ